MDDAEKWADPYDSSELLFAGAWFLYDRLLELDRNAPLLARIRACGNSLNSMQKLFQGGKPTAELAAPVLEELNLLGTLGYSLWHLRSALDTRGLEYELRELSQLSSSNTPGDLLRLRGQGFLFLCAAEVAKRGFSIEFVPRVKSKATPDFVASRGSLRVACEATSRYPTAEKVIDSDLFWRIVTGVVKKKKRQLVCGDYDEGALFIDCTPVWDALDLSQIASGATLAYFIPAEIGGPKTGQAPLINYERSAARDHLRSLESAIDGTLIRTIVLWKFRFEWRGDSYWRRNSFRVLGSLMGTAFWGHFERAMAFPGPGVKVDWGTVT